MERNRLCVRWKLGEQDGGKKKGGGMILMDEIRTIDYFLEATGSSKRIYYRL